MQLYHGNARAKRPLPLPNERRPERAGRTRTRDLAAARRFYCDLLEARQVWRTGIAESRAALWFIVNQRSRLRRS